MCQQSIYIFISGLYPQIAWRLGDEVVFVMEGTSHDTGSLIKWAEQIGIIIHYHTELP
jgi:putative glycerol kinase 5